MQFPQTDVLKLTDIFVTKVCNFFLLLKKSHADLKHFFIHMVIIPPVLFYVQSLK